MRPPPCCEMCPDYRAVHAEPFCVLYQHERSFDFLVGLPESPEEHSHKSGGTLRSRQQHKRASCTQINSRGSRFHFIGPRDILHSPSNITGDLSSFRQFHRFAEYTITSLEEYETQHSNWRKAPSTPNHLERRADSLALSQEEGQLSTCTAREVVSLL